MQKEGGDHFIEFMKIISNKQCQDDPDFDLRQVWKFIVMVFHANISKVFQFDAELSRPWHNCIYCGKMMTTS